MFNGKNDNFSASKAILVLASGLLVGVFLVALLSQMLARIAGLDQLAVMRLATTLQNVIMFMLPAVAVGALFGGRLPLRFLRLDSAPSAKAIVGIVVISIAMTPAMNWLVAWNASLSLPDALKPMEEWMRAQEDAAQTATDTLLSGTSVWDLIASLVCVGLLTGMGEEMFFRGALQRSCVEGLRNKHLAVWTAAFVFSALHFQFFGFVPRMVLGAVFGYAYLWSGSLWVPIVGHALNNSAVVVFTWMSHNGAAQGMENAGSDTLWVAVVSAALTVSLLTTYKKILNYGGGKAD